MLEVQLFCCYVSKISVQQQILATPKLEMRETHRGSQRRSVMILQQDNARPHTAQLTRETINKMRW